MVASAAGANSVGAFGVFHNELSTNRRGAVSGPGGVTGGTAGGGGAVGAGTVVVIAVRVVLGAAVVVVGATVVGVGAGGRAGAIVVVVGVVTAGGGVSASPGRTGTSSRHVDEEPFAGSRGRKPASRMSSRCSPLQRPLEPSCRRGCRRDAAGREGTEADPAATVAGATGRVRCLPGPRPGRVRKDRLRGDGRGAQHAVGDCVLLHGAHSGQPDPVVRTRSGRPVATPATATGHRGAG